MQRTCIAVVDATRARVLTFARSVDPSGIREELSERADLVNPARRKTPAQLFSDSRPGSSRIGGRGFAFDDHRNAHMDQFDAEFAREITAAVKLAIKDSGATRLIVCASPRMLGALRAADINSNGIAIDELGRDYSKLTIPQLRAQLVDHGLLPAEPTRPGLVREA